METQVQKGMTRQEIEKILNAQANKVVMFKNFSAEDFECSWDGVPESVKAGEVTYFPRFKAEVYSKHLVDREMNRDGLATNDSRRETYLKRCLSAAQDQTEATKAMAEGEFKKEEPSSVIARKPGRPKKTDEDTFAGLK